MSHIPPPKASARELERADWRLEWDVRQALVQLGQEYRFLGVGDDLGELRETLGSWRPHLAFNLLDEFAGNTHLDHNVASYLEMMRVPYTGCNPRGLILARDKALTKKLLSYHGIAVPEFFVFPRGRKVKLAPAVPFPMIVKSLTEEASLGISQSSVVTDPRRLLERVAFIHESVGSDAIAERYIEGRELYAGVIGNSRLETFPVWELRFDRARGHRIATRQAKWSPEYRKKNGIVSAKARNLSADLERKIQEIGKQVYRITGMSGYARVDLRLSESGEIFVLEANPNPHLGEEEELAESARHAGLTYPELIQRILNLALSWQPGQLQVA